LLAVAAAVLGICGTAQAALAPGLYDGHAPKGRIAADNLLTAVPGAHGVIMVVHGGGWVLVGPQALDIGQAAWFNANGYSSYDVDYRPGADSLVDVVAAYDRLRRELGAATEICAYGASVGGQLVELLAASRPSLDCVLSQAGVEDVRAIPHQCAYGHVCGFLTKGARWAWGSALWQFSPVRLARYISQPFLAAGSSFDRLIDERDQLAEMKRVRPATETMLLPGAARPPAGLNENFVHASVTAPALSRYDRAVLRLIEAARRTRRRR
jgi:acetyl esterase/lipase